MKKDVNILQEPENMQFSVAKSTTNSDILDILVNSPNDLVRMTAVENPAIKTETLKKKVDDEDVGVRWKAREALEKRGVQI